MSGPNHTSPAPKFLYLLTASPWKCQCSVWKGFLFTRECLVHAQGRPEKPRCSCPQKQPSSSEHTELCGHTYFSCLLLAANLTQAECLWTIVVSWLGTVLLSYGPCTWETGGRKLKVPRAFGTSLGFRKPSQINKPKQNTTWALGMLSEVLAHMT